MQVVREMYGAMVAEGAESVSIVTSGMYTQEARNFSEGKAIDLVDGGQLLKMVRSVQDFVAPADDKFSTAMTRNDVPETCPKCGSELVTRTARRGSSAGSEFIGCSSFPNCRYTRDV